MWATVKPVLVLLPILGLTWLAGILVHLSPAWAYATVGLNSLQGPYIFLVYAACNREVRSALQRVTEKKVVLAVASGDPTPWPAPPRCAPRTTLQPGVPQEDMWLSEAPPAPGSSKPSPHHRTQEIGEAGWQAGLGSDRSCRPWGPGLGSGPECQGHQVEGGAIAKVAKGEGGGVGAQPVPSGGPPYPFCPRAVELTALTEHNSGMGPPPLGPNTSHLAPVVRSIHTNLPQPRDWCGPPTPYRALA
ncbi:proline-rich protein HaeIII subfamily 1-like isoform X2 [Fukomys damarensis]|uniref:proline-rich protein HaeIII subfamily 1-like isoform X2 n=1 Tax=Fukomys damarensis TaxID=885580 RepID=UPI001454EADB|nr:proline-rich protein HaeIII subfamily 1-like isoform X2 [Fukomys damarensis]